MSLLDACVRLDRWPIQVATVDHGLHPDSNRHAVFVVEQARDRGVEATILTVDPSALRGGHGPEARARAARYALLEAHRVATAARWLVTAHSADDQAETVLMRLGRGAGTHGLGAMSSRRGALVRPWLGVQRASIAAYAERHGVDWVEDPTNADGRFERNALRQGPMAEMGALYGAAWVERVSAAAARVRGERSLLRELLTSGPAALLRTAPDGIGIDVRAVRALPVEARAAAIAEAIRMASWQMQGRPIRGMAPHVRRLSELVQRGGAPISLPAGLAAWRDGDAVVVGQAPSRAAAPLPSTVDGPGAVCWGSWLITISADDGTAPRSHCVARDRAPWPWSIRAPRPGEAFRPSGGVGRRSISRALRDAGVARHLRHRIPVVTAAEQTIYIGRLRADDAVRPRSGDSAWRISIERAAP